jgi:hypothetical protein
VVPIPGNEVYRGETSHGQAFPFFSSTGSQHFTA